MLQFDVNYTMYLYRATSPNRQNRNKAHININVKIHEPKPTTSYALRVTPANFSL